MTLNLDDLIARVRYPYGAFDQTHQDLANALESTAAKLREAEEVLAGADHTAAKYWRKMRVAEAEMHARELHHFEEEKLRAEAEDKLREAETAIEKVRSILPGPRTFTESLPRDFAGNLWPRTIDADNVAAILATYKPTNQEGES